VSFLVCWVQRTLVLAWLSPKSAKLVASNSAKKAWHVQNQPHRAFITWQEYHPLEPYGGNEMVQQWFFLVCWVQRTLVLALLWLKSAKLLASNSAKKAWHGMSKISLTEPS
jgi:hypothetical protein